MKSFAILMLLCCAGLVTAGDLNPPAAPTTGTMKTLDEVEPRIPIHQSDIPLTITTSGSYYLAENVTYTGSGGCITITVDDVTVDMKGFTMNGGGTADYGVFISNCNNVEVRNGSIHEFVYGVFKGPGDGDNYRILGLTISSWQISGIYLQSGFHCRVMDCTVTGGGTAANINGDSYCIYVGGQSIVSGNMVHHNQTSLTADWAYSLCVGEGGTVMGNHVYSNAESITTSYYYYGIYTHPACVIRENVVYENGKNATHSVYGIRTSDGCRIKDNAVYRNGITSGDSVYGIYTGRGNVVGGNAVSYNGTSASGNVYGIFAYISSTVSSNNIYSNGTSAVGSVTGLYNSSGNVVTGNTVRSNGTSSSGTVRGIYLYGYNLVNNNSAYQNAGTGGGTNMTIDATCSYGTNVAP